MYKRQVQNTLINLVKQNPDTFSDLLGDKLDAVVNFNFTFFGIDLSQVPSDVGLFSVAIIIPVLSVVTMILVNVVTLSMSEMCIRDSTVSADLRVGWLGSLPRSCMVYRMRRCTGFKPSRTSGSARWVITDME